jgi:hypothetical protein
MCWEFPTCWRHDKRLLRLGVGGYYKGVGEEAIRRIFVIPSIFLAASYGLWLGVMAIGGSVGRKAHPSDSI